MSWKYKFRVFVASCVCLAFLLFGLGLAVPVEAAASLDLNQVEAVFQQAIARGDTSVSFQTRSEYSMAELQKKIQEAALADHKICVGGYRYQKRNLGRDTEYVFYFTSQNFKKVTVLKSEHAARKAAVKALRKCSYSKLFYSKQSYLNEFMRILQQHAEYNYDTVLWHSTNGTYGFRRSSELTKSEQDQMMAAADKEAARVAREIAGSKGTVQQQLKAIHDYLIRSCDYNYRVTSTSGFDTAFTAYGALVRHSAVCQGYASAFDLIARKAGLKSMTVSGRAGGQSHAWNFVKYGGQCRYIDCTWDDTASTRDYFLVTKTRLQRDHSWTERDFNKNFFRYC